MKKLISMLLVLTLTLGLLTSAAFAADFDDGGLGDWDSSSPCGGNLVWSLVDGVLTITGTGAMTDWTTSAQSIPWTGSLDQITKIVVCDGVTTIGGRAFQNMPELDCVILPETLKTIGAYAFAGCTELDDVCFAGTQAQWNAVSVPNSADLGDKTVYLVELVGDHWIAHMEENAPACEVEGNVEYWYCPECDGYFADALGEDAITEDDVIVEALAHDYAYGICTVCGKADPNADIKVLTFGADHGAATFMGAAYKNGKLIGMFDSVSVGGTVYSAVPTDLYKKMDTAKLFQLDENYAPLCAAGEFSK